MGILVGISEGIGLREQMEDDYAVYDRPEWHFFSAEVYDGHAGREAARFATEMLTPHFLNSWLIEREKPEETRRPDEELLREAYIAVDKYIAYRRIMSGAAAATLYLLGEKFMAANAGDTRVIIGSDSGAQVLTLDHRPDVPGERSRIEGLGGTITHFGIPRVMGFLAMSRALGDTELKPYVTSEPRIASGLLGRENDYAVVACDGVWDVLTPEKAIGLARRGETPERGADIIRDAAFDEGSTDNITVIVLDLRRYTAALDRQAMEVSQIFDRAGSD
jgi:serine/threonine protein phosphatase PrpC